MQLPQIRTAALSGGQFITGFIAAVAYMSSKSVDLYAAWDKLYQGTQLILGAWALVGPVLIGAYAVYKSSFQQKIIDVASFPQGVQAAQQTAPTPQVVAVADALKKEPA